MFPGLTSTKHRILIANKYLSHKHKGIMGLDGVAQSIMCLATDACLTADPGVVSLNPARSHTFMEIDHETILRSLSSLPLNHSRRVVVS